MQSLPLLWYSPFGKHELDTIGQPCRPSILRPERSTNKGPNRKKMGESLSDIVQIYLVNAGTCFREVGIRRDYRLITDNRNTDWVRNGMSGRGTKSVLIYLFAIAFSISSQLSWWVLHHYHVVAFSHSVFLGCHSPQISVVGCHFHRCRTTYATSLHA